MINNIINYSIYISYLIIGLFILHIINNLLLYYIFSEYILIILELGIIIVQADNISLLYDYKNLKKFYEKLINDEYRINKLTNITNNLLKKYQKLEDDYYDLLNSNNVDKNKIKLLNIDILKYVSIFNNFEHKFNILKNKLHSSKSEIITKILYNKKLRLCKSEQFNDKIKLIHYENKNEQLNNNINELRLLNYNDNDYYDIFTSNIQSLNSSSSNSPDIKPFNSSLNPFNSSPINPFNSSPINPFNSSPINPFNNSSNINNYSETNLYLYNNFINDIDNDFKKIKKERSFNIIESKKNKKKSYNNLNELYNKFIV